MPGADTNALATFSSEKFVRGSRIGTWHISMHDGAQVFLFWELGDFTSNEVVAGRFPKKKVAWNSGRQDGCVKLTRMG